MSVNSTADGEQQHAESQPPGSPPAAPAGDRDPVTENPTADTARNDASGAGRRAPMMPAVMFLVGALTGVVGHGLAAAYLFLNAMLALGGYPNLYDPGLGPALLVIVVALVFGGAGYLWRSPSPVRRWFGPGLAFGWLTVTVLTGGEWTIEYYLQ